MRESGSALTTGDRSNVTQVTAVSAWLKRWLHCDGRGISVFHCVISAADMCFVRCIEKVECEKALWELVCSHSGQSVPEVSLSLVTLRPPFHMIYLMNRLDCCICDRSFKSRLQTHVRPLIVRWYRVEVFSILPSCCASHYAVRPVVPLIISPRYLGGGPLRVMVCCRWQRRCARLLFQLRHK